MYYRFIGRWQDEKSDKLWGVIVVHDSIYVIFWGKRGGKLKTKIAHYTRRKLCKLICNKEDRGYQEVDQNQLSSVYENFDIDLKKAAMWATLKVPHG